MPLESSGTRAQGEQIQLGETASKQMLGARSLCIISKTLRGKLFWVLRSGKRPWGSINISFSCPCRGLPRQSQQAGALAWADTCPEPEQLLSIQTTSRFHRLSNITALPGVPKASEARILPKFAQLSLCFNRLLTQLVFSI